MISNRSDYLLLKQPEWWSIYRKRTTEFNVVKASIKYLFFRSLYRKGFGCEFHIVKKDACTVIYGQIHKLQNYTIRF